MNIMWRKTQMEQMGKIIPLKEQNQIIRHEGWRKSKLLVGLPRGGGGGGGEKGKMRSLSQTYRVLFPSMEHVVKPLRSWTLAHCPHPFWPFTPKQPPYTETICLIWNASLRPVTISLQVKQVAIAVYYTQQNLVTWCFQVRALIQNKRLIDLIFLTEKRKCWNIQLIMDHFTLNQDSVSQWHKVLHGAITTPRRCRTVGTIRAKSGDG